MKTDAGTVLKLEVKINDEVARFVLGLGPSAIALKPESLRHRVAELASEICERCKAKAA